MQGPDETPVPELGFDPEAVLERDSRVLLDRAFLETLHAELAREVDGDTAAATLLQMGFLHGLLDVGRALAATAGARPGAPCVALAPPLRMPCRPLADAPAQRGLVIEGHWPDHCEAAAHVSALGVDRDVVCHLSAGYTSGWLSGAFDADLLVIETGCSANGRRECRFIAREAADWRERGDDVVLRTLDALPFDVFRALVRERLARASRETRVADSHEVAEMDRGTRAVHVWGPVMVLSYAGPDETLRALGLLARDPGVADVSVIVVDLGGAIVDETYGSMALEQLVQTAETWGAETLFVDPSPLSEPALAGLEHPPLLVMKDMEAAIALGFQIARSQRRHV